jgi:hypothetical protein
MDSELGGRLAVVVGVVELDVPRRLENRSRTEPGSRPPGGRRFVRDRQHHRRRSLEAPGYFVEAEEGVRQLPREIIESGRKTRDPGITSTPPRVGVPSVRQDLAASDGFDGAHEALAGQLDTRLVTLATKTVDLQPMSDGDESVFPANPVLDSIELAALELQDRSALEANEVFVNRMLREPVLIPLEAFSEVVLLNQPTAHQEVERAIDRRLPDPASALT